jgi:cytochrome P450
MDSKLPPEQKTMRHLAEEAGSLIGAGTVTTAWALTVAVFNLLREPECLEKLKRELIEALPSGEAETGKGLLASLEKLPYLHAVIQEALRLSYGVASRLARIAPDEELVVPGNMEWRIPANTPVSMTQLQLFRDSKMFPSPLRFRPERWIENPRLDRFQFVFCKGSRICLGKNLAIAEMQLLLAGLFLTHGSKDVNMEHDIGYLELWQTDESDVECSVDAFVPQPKRDTKGVRCKIHRK